VDGCGLHIVVLRDSEDIDNVPAYYVGLVLWRWRSMRSTTCPTDPMANYNDNSTRRLTGLWPVASVRNIMVWVGIFWSWWSVDTGGSCLRSWSYNPIKAHSSVLGKQMPLYY
jgi:hypothetical protein